MLYRPLREDRRETVFRDRRFRQRRAGFESPALAAANPDDIIERVVFWLFVLGLAWVPYWYGGNDLIAWGINAVIFPGLAGCYEISLLARRRNHPLAIANVAPQAVLFIAAILWAWLQTLPWTHSALVHPIWAMAAQALDIPVDGSITVNRDLTNLALLRLVTAASVLWLAAQLCRDPARALRLLQAIAAIGSAYAAYGLAAVGFPSFGLPGLDIPLDGALLSSTFINRNTFATYAGLALVAATGLTLRVYRREMVGPEAGWRLQLASLVDATGTKAAAPLAAAFIILVALLLTGSRGGVIAAAAGLFVLGLFAHRRSGGSGRRASLVVAPIIILTAATLLAFGGFFFGSIEERGVFDSDRISVYTLTIRSILDAPWLGHGYGTFIDVFPLYRDRSIGVQGTWGQAHDTYLEVFQGLGLLFGTMLVASVLLTVLDCLRGSVRRHAHATVPSVATSAAVLVGVHAVFDFGLQIQAVAVTFMALLGAGVAQSKDPRPSEAGHRSNADA